MCTVVARSIQVLCTGVTAEKTHLTVNEQLRSSRILLCIQNRAAETMPFHDVHGFATPVLTTTSISRTETLQGFPVELLNALPTHPAVKVSRNKLLRTQPVCLASKAVEEMVKTSPQVMFKNVTWALSGPLTRETSTSLDDENPDATETRPMINQICGDLRPTRCQSRQTC